MSALQIVRRDPVLQAVVWEVGRVHSRRLPGGAQRALREPSGTRAGGKEMGHSSHRKM